MYIFIVAGFVLLLVALWEYFEVRPARIWAALKSQSVKADGYAWWRSLAHWPWWSTPGWIAQNVGTSLVADKLSLAQVPLSVADFYGLKQWLWSSGSVCLMLWLWFGDFSGSRLGLFLLVFGLSFFLPDLWLLSVVARTRRKIKQQVPPFLDLLTLTLQGGGNLEQALVSTTKHSSGALADLLARHLKELNWGRSLEAIFADLKKLVPDSGFQHFLTSLLRAKKLGVSLSETLAVQTELLRTRRRQQAEELSRTAAVKISVPLVLFIFPALLIIYIGPGILQLMQPA